LQKTTVFHLSLQRTLGGFQFCLTPLKFHAHSFRARCQCFDLPQRDVVESQMSADKSTAEWRIPNLSLGIRCICSFTLTLFVRLGKATKAFAAKTSDQRPTVQHLVDFVFHTASQSLRVHL
jgi:hypothetical protein